LPVTTVDVLPEKEPDEDLLVDDLVEVPPEIDRPVEVDELLDEEPPLTPDDLDPPLPDECDPPLTDECDPPLNPFASTKFGTIKIIDNTSASINLNFIFSNPFLIFNFSSPNTTQIT
jgi:hypothetical protein